MDGAREQRFRAIASECTPRIASYLARRSFTFNRLDIEDMVEETLVIAWRHLDEIIVGSELPWLVGVAHNVLNNARRKESRRRRLVGRLRPVGDAPSAEESVIAHDELRRAITKLGSRHREVLLLHYWDGFTVAEIALILGISPGSAAVRLTRATQSVRIALTDDSDINVKK